MMNELFFNEKVIMKRMKYKDFINVKEIYDSFNMLYVYETKHNFYYSLNKIDDTSEDINVLIFKDAHDLVEFLYHKNDMTTEIYYKLLGYPETAISNIINDKVNFDFEYGGLKIICNRDDLPKIHDELKLMYEKEVK